jgi:hypothetical protein
MPLSADLANKSVHAAIAAIEIYNKPNFFYREEAFALLMANAWELLLKAKWILDHAEAVESVYELVEDATNYLLLATEWFQLDLSGYNFFLMPISFYHGFETAEPATRVHYPEQIQRLLAFLDSLEARQEQEECKQHISLRLETKLVRGKDASAVAFRWTDDPSAPLLTIREEDILRNYPMTYRDLATTMRRRYEDFLENAEFHRLRQALEQEHKYSLVRLLNPSNPNTSKQRFFNANILQEFDKHYTRRKKS